MNKFISQRSRFSVFLCICVTIALFNDSANLTDLLPSTTTVHFEGADGPSIAAYVGNNLASTENSHSAPNTLDSRAKDTPPHHVLLDEDSPSLAAISFTSLETISFQPQFEVRCYESVSYSDLLYLQYRKLLI